MFNKLKHWLRLIHKYTGIAMSFLFVVWFFSGFIMIYHSFPKPQPQQYYHGLKSFSGHDSIANPSNMLTLNKAHALSLEMLNDRPVYRFSGRHTKVFYAHDLQELKPLTTGECQKMLQTTFTDSVHHLQQLNTFDQWIPWRHYQAHFPIQKFEIDNGKGTHIYVSSTKGLIVQHTTAQSRLLAWLGAIPHWMYFKHLRLHATLWSQVVIVLSFIGCLVCLSGIILGIVRYRKRRNSKLGGITPFKKPWYRWHHITGLVFGLFVFTFILSGLMSLANVPDWWVRKEKDQNYYQQWNGSPLHTSDTINGFQLILKKKGASSVKRIVCRKTMERTFYEIYKETRDQSECYTVDEGIIKPMDPLSTFVVEKRVQDLWPQKQYSIQLLSEYNQDYYRRKKGNAPLPVYQVKFDDAYGTTLYIDQRLGQLLKVSNHATKWHWWLYQGLHTFNFGWFRQVEWLRQSWLIFLSVGGTVISVTAFVLGLNYFKRKI